MRSTIGRGRSCVSSEFKASMASGRRIFGLVLGVSGPRKAQIASFPVGGRPEKPI